MDNIFEIPINRRDFMKMTGMAAAEKNAADTAGEPGIVPAAADGGKNATIECKKHTIC